MYLSFNEQHYCVDSDYSDEPYGDWWADYEFIPPTEAYPQTTPYYGAYPYIGPEIEYGTTLYVVYVLWSSGDSFGNSSQGDYEILSVNQDKDKAQTNLKRILRSQSTVEILNDDGTTQSLYCGGWHGYFESIDKLEMVQVEFKKEN